MEIMRHHLHGLFFLHVGKPERIRRTGQARERWNCFYIRFPVQRGPHFKISRTWGPENTGWDDHNGQPHQQQAIKSKLFSALCSATESANTHLLLHTEVTWLSRRREHTWFYELREDLIIFFTFEESELADLLSDETWCNKVTFLADISQHLNTLNKRMQGKKENIPTCTDKIKSFKEKPTM
jgi:hypothetical protein